MYEVSWHTHQINLWIALTTFEPTFSSTLGELGYKCDVVEEKFYILDEDGERTIHPDVVLTSSSNDHSLVIDCKSEEVDQDQLEKYLAVENQKEQLVVQGIVDSVEADELSIDETISSFRNLEDKPIPGDFAVVHFDQDPHSGLAIWNLDSYQFSGEEVRDEFPINMHPDEPLPTSHYPFDIYEADKEAMVSAALSSVISLAMKQGEYSIEDVLDMSHPHWDKLGEEKREELLERVEIIHLELLEAGLDQYLEKISGTQGKEWGRTSKTIQSVHDNTDYYVDRVMDKLPQSRLDHHAWSPSAAE